MNFWFSLTFWVRNLCTAWSSIPGHNSSTLLWHGNRSTFFFNSLFLQSMYISLKSYSSTSIHRLQYVDCHFMYSPHFQLLQSSGITPSPALISQNALHLFKLTSLQRTQLHSYLAPYPAFIIPVSPARIQPRSKRSQKSTTYLPQISSLAPPRLSQESSKCYGE